MEHQSVNQFISQPVNLPPVPHHITHSSVQNRIMIHHTALLACTTLATMSTLPTIRMKITSLAATFLVSGHRATVAASSPTPSCCERNGADAPPRDGDDEGREDGGCGCCLSRRGLGEEVEGVAAAPLPGDLVGDNAGDGAMLPLCVSIERRAQ